MAGFDGIVAGPRLWHFRDRGRTYGAAVLTGN